MNDDVIYRKLFQIVKFSKWDKLIEYYLDQRHSWNNWIFRGQRDSRWGLKTKLERTVFDRFKLPQNKMPNIEMGLLRKFMREFHNYSDYLPKYNDKDNDERIECISIMQHHGAPTRLLDCTYSFFVALFFAIEQVELGESCAIWVFNPQWLSDQSQKVIPEDDLRQRWVTKDPEIVNKILWHSPRIPIIYPDNPLRKTRRLSAQQGVFLVPGDEGRPFIDNLRAIARSSESKDNLIKIMINCNKSFLNDALKELYRMKLDSETLFPGLDGFARHLENLIPVPGAIWYDRNT